jgi:hypothetical protein
MLLNTLAGSAYASRVQQAFVEAQQLGWSTRGLGFRVGLVYWVCGIATLVDT